MKLSFFAVPMPGGDEESQELNRFLSTTGWPAVWRDTPANARRSVLPEGRHGDDASSATSVDPPSPARHSPDLGLGMGRGSTAWSLVCIRGRRRRPAPSLDPSRRFWMGSPRDEEGRSSYEGPRHLVSIDSGFWMFDTPCTQALWEAVMGENPSHFKVADRPRERADHPVESVSWEQCQEFLTALNSRLDGLQLSLSSEAQWEYACRAGTETSRYSENPDAIAWYDKNSGNETHSVAGKEANSWGLYDMLGNVWEWCADALGEGL